LLLAPGVLSAWSYVIVWWHVFYDGTVRFFRYTSQHIVSYTLAAIAFATPFLLQLIPAVPVQNSVDDSIYRFVARLLGVIGMAGAITVWLVLFFRKMWIDRRTGRFLTWVGFAAICFGIPQGMYLWAITGSGNPRLWYDIGSTFDMLGALCLVPATLRLVGLLRTYRFGRWTSRLFGMREAFALLFTWFLFFSLGSAALAWAQANIVKERPYWAVAEINADTIRKAVKAAIEGDATHDDTMLRSGTLPDLAPWIGLDPWAFANSSFAAEDYRVIVDDRSDPRRGWRVHLESSRGGPTARLDVYADGSMHLTPGVEPWMIWKAGMWSIAIGLMIYALIVLWIHTLTMLFSSSFLPWAGFACSLSLIGLSILLHAFELASGERLDLYLVRQHYAINAGAGLILACTMLMIVVFRYQVQFRIYGDDARTPLGEAEQLRQVVSKLVWSILRNVETWFGKQRQFALRRAFEARCGDGVTIDAGELTDPLTKDSEDVVEVGRRLRTLFNRITNAFIDEFGSQLYQRALVNLHDALFWRERELAHTHIFAGAWWGVRLRHYDDAALTPAKKREIFQRIPLFTGFSEEEMVALMARFREEAFGANEVVFRPGEESDRLYIVLSGRVSIEQELDERAAAQSHRPIAELRRGDWFGEISLIKEATRAATVICLEPTTMLSLDRNTYLALADRYHAIGRKIEEAFDFLMLIDDMPVFRELTAQRIRELATSMRLRLVEPGERVVREGEPGRCFYIVRQGRFNVIEHLGDPDERHLDTLIRGDYFGELALLEDMPRSASVVALEPGELLELDRDDFERLLGKYVAMTSRSARQANRRHFESRVRKQMATRKRHQTTAAHTGGDTDPHGLHGDDRGTTVVRARHRLVDRTTRRVPRRSRSGRITAVGADGPFPSPGSSDDHIPPPAMPEMPD
ncbi:MAG: cyclic nucleotide-binding domain-containing protein, partial [Planctomycetota bacterium]